MDENSWLQSANQAWYEELRRTQPQSKPWIRLLTLRAGAPDAPINCALSVVTLDSKPTYDALSYCWGSAKRSVIITVNGKQGFKITENLWAALRRLRNYDGARRIWADAICIDQSNPAERTTHVQNMDGIYSKAKEVCIYIGECDAVTFVKKARAPAAGSGSVLTWEHQQQKQRIHLSSRRIRVAGPRNHAAEVGELILNQLVSGKSQKERKRNLWWERIWTVQELLLAKSPKVYCGPYTFDWRDVGEFWGRSDACQGLRGEAAADFESMNRLRSEAGHGDMHRLLSETLEKGCSEPKDRVYALLGLRSAKDNMAFSPDYTISLSQVCAKLAIQYIQRTGRVDILFDIWGRNYSIDHRPDGLRSWMPDFCDATAARVKRQTLRRSIPLLQPEQGRWEMAKLKTYWAPSRKHDDEIDMTYSLTRHNAQVAEYGAHGRDNPVAMTGYIMDEVVRLHTLGSHRLSDIIDSEERDIMDTESPRSSSVHGSQRMLRPSDSVPSRRWRAYELYSFLKGVWEHRAPDLAFSKHNTDGHNRDYLRLSEPSAYQCYMILVLLEDMLLSPPPRTNRSILYPPVTSTLRTTIKIFEIEFYGDRNEHWMPYILCEMLEDIVEALGKDQTWSGTFFATAKGHLGIGPEATQIGDTVAVILGARSRHVLHSVEGHYALLGDAFVSGLMGGEVKEMEERGDLEAQEIILL
ncbi:hypothetical protein LTR85_000819 [Meristemomyces frigidus]|nr:hypothetical protein LTR85_000819 [Meristemomyces frigidus]